METTAAIRNLHCLLVEILAIQIFHETWPHEGAARPSWVKTTEDQKEIYRRQASEIGTEPE